MSHDQEVTLHAQQDRSWTARFEATAEPSSVTVPQSSSVTVQYTIEDMTCAFVAAEWA